MSLYYVSSVYVGAPCTGVPYYAIATKSPYADCRYYNSLPSYKNCTTTIGNPDPLSRSYGIIDCISADSVDKLFRKLAPGTDVEYYLNYSLLFMRLLLYPGVKGLKMPIQMPLFR